MTNEDLFNAIVSTKADSDKKHEEVLGAILSLKDATEMHFVGSDKRLERVEVRLERVEVRLERVEVRLDRVEMRLGHLTTRVEGVEDGLKAVRTDVAGLQRRSG